MLDALVREARLRWGLDPAAGVQVVAAERLAGSPIEPSRPLLVVPLAALGGEGTVTAPTSTTTASTAPAVLPGRGGHGADPLAVLARLYPADHQVGRFGRPEAATVGGLGPDDLAAGVYVGPVAVDLAPTGAWALPWISHRLRQPDGCPWDREQTHESLRKHLLEEAYEVYDALERGATPELAEELGDLLLQIILHSQLAAEAGVFDLADVSAGLGRKIVRRHPHVFGDAVAATSSDVNRQWERIKADERKQAAATAAADESGSAAPPKSALDGITRSMPALAASQEMQERAAAVGYDWPTIDGIVEKIREELDEVLEAETPDEIREELGDLMMVIVNLARRHGVEAEAAVRAANEKFRRRFGSVERQAAARGVALRDLSFEQLDELWDAAKAETAEEKQR